jgi:DNA ligase-1
MEETPMTSLPTLYKLTKTGAVQQWTVSYEDNKVITRWGQQGGAIQTTSEVVTGKNTGKSNETTDTQQAAIEALAQWVKQTKKGYVETVEKAKAGEVGDVIKGGINPMLAEKFSDFGNEVVWPAYAQPKLDGHRCIAVITNSSVTLWSRTRKEILSVPHIAEALRSHIDIPEAGKRIILDGELYNHSLKSDFEELTSAIRKQKPSEASKKVVYHIYDFPTAFGGFGERHQQLLDLLLKNGMPPRCLVSVATHKVQSEETMRDLFSVFLDEGYEGLMVRSAAGHYEERRSRNLLKVKEFQDAEFPIIGVEEGKGKLAGHAIFVCKTDSGQEFRCKLKGEQSHLKSYFLCPELVIGRLLTVKFQELTKDGIPRFPVGERIREDV